MEAEKVVSQIEKSGRKAVALKFDVSDIKSFDNIISEMLISLQTNWDHPEQHDFVFMVIQFIHH